MLARTASDRDHVLYEIAAELSSSLDLDEVLRNAIDRVLALFRASRGFVVLIDPNTRKMRIRMARGEGGHDQAHEQFSGSRSVIEEVIATGTPIVTTDASLDHRFSARDSVILHNLRSILAVPLVSKGSVTGALYVDNPFRSGIFSEADRDLLQVIANQAAIAIENARLYTELRRNYEHVDFLRRTFERYVNKQVMERVLAEPNGGFLAGEKLKVTMLASDLVGFSRLTQTLSAERLVAMLNDYFRHMVDIVLKHGGNIDKFQGDGLLVVFGAPVPMPDSASRALAAAREMRAAVERINSGGVRLDCPIEVGIGIDTGEVIAGNVGSDKRLEYTLIGVPVNNATFLSKERPAGVFMTQNVRDEVGAIPGVTQRQPITPKGSRDPLPIYELDKQ